MTPVSKKRKPAKPATVKAPRRPQDPALELYKGAASTFARLDRNPLPLLALELGSGIAGMMEVAEFGGAALDIELYTAVVGHAERLQLPGSLGLLAALAATTWPRTNNPRSSPLVANAARLAADTAGLLRAKGHEDPAWIGPLGSMKVTRAVELTDVFGDYPQLMFELRAGRRKFALHLATDTNHMGGYATDVLPMPGLVRPLKALAAKADEDPLLRAPIELEVTEAVRRARAALAATDMTSDPEIDEGFAEFRGFAYACLAAVDEDSLAYSELELKRRELEEQNETEELEVLKAELARQFQAETKAKPAAANRGLAQWYLEFSHNYDDNRLTRISPVKIGTFLEWYLPRKVMLDAAEEAAVPGFVKRWVPWCGAREGLSDDAVEEVREAADDVLIHLRELENRPGQDQEPPPVGKAFLAGLELGNIEDVQLALRVRQLAMPYFGTRIGAADYPRLDANRPDQLRLLVLGEIPDFHSVAADALPLAADD
ncbi:MAG: hypothetical protein ACHP7K_12015, partial [Actinomycetales bacterium]